MVHKMSVYFALLAIVLLQQGAEGGLLEEPGVNNIDKHSPAVPNNSPCLTSERTGVVPCDTNPDCCLKDSPRIPGTNYCCPLGSEQYHFLNMNDFICACAV